ncbi:MAG: aspartyl/asparaginyl beta-hydroxylase domain-containing protein [Acidobacteriota bacterium]
MQNYIKLPFTFDSDQLKNDLATILPTEWSRHFNDQYFHGDWSGVALRSVGGLVPQLYLDPNADNRCYSDTSLLARCRYMQQVINTFQCEKEAVRLLRLGPKSSIREHVDYGLGYQDGSIRVHIPVVTNPDVDFYLAGEQIIMREGESWYLDFSLPHRVENRGATDRIHLVIDCCVNDWIGSLLF